jgi:hypothetical protein
MAQVVQHLRSKLKVLSSNPDTVKTPSKSKSIKSHPGPEANSRSRAVGAGLISRYWLELSSRDGKELNTYCVVIKPSQPPKQGYRTVSFPSHQTQLEVLALVGRTGVGTHAGDSSGSKQFQGSSCRGMHHWGSSHYFTWPTTWDLGIEALIWPLRTLCKGAVGQRMTSSASPAFRLCSSAIAHVLYR